MHDKQEPLDEDDQKPDHPHEHDNEHDHDHEDEDEHEHDDDEEDDDEEDDEAAAGGTSRAASGQKLFACSYENCGKAFARRSDLVRHNRIHTNERWVTRRMLHNLCLNCPCLSLPRY